MKLKLDDKGAVVVQDGKPVYVLPDGREIAHDAEATVATISRLNGEAKSHREAKEAAEAKLKPFEGIDDPEAARAALNTVKNIKDGDLVPPAKSRRSRTLPRARRRSRWPRQRAPRRSARELSPSRTRSSQPT
jgi:hypothetical protein